MFGIEREGAIIINPGNEMTIDGEDTLFYICLTGEENAQIIQNDLRIVEANGDGGGKSFTRECSVNSTCSMDTNHGKS